jgi:hypothetical protein
MNLLEMITAMEAAGIPAEQILSAVKHHQQGKLESQRESTRERVRAHRERKRAVTDVTQVTRYTEQVPPDGFPDPSLTPLQKTPKGVQKVPQHESEFDQFWKIFPATRKGNRDKALSAWNRAVCRAEPEQILRGVQAYLRSSEVRDGFAKGAAAWLNDDRWTCTYTEPIRMPSKYPSPTQPKITALTL